VRITVVGAGYVGLVCAAGLAELGNEVVGVDVDAARVARLQAGEVPIFEPQLEELLSRNVAAGRLRFTTELAEAVPDAEVVFMCVGTPGNGHGHADLSAVFAAAEAVATHAGRELVLVLKSTVPVGTHARVRRIVERADVPVHVVSNPEFLKEGSAVADFQRPARVIVGVPDGDAFARRTMQRVYRPLSLDADRILWMDPASAELSKYVANAMLAMRIAFMNEVAVLCETVDADVHAVRLGVGSDPRIGPKFLYAGPGYGGSCFPKDVVALVQTGRDHGVELALAATTHAVNERHKGLLLRKLKRHFDGDLRGRRFAVWGAAFKPETDDIRDAPTLALVDGLLAEGSEVAVHDPAALHAVRARFPSGVRTCADPYEAAEGADGLVLMTEWAQYRSPDFARLAATMATPLLLDGRNIWSTYGLREQGFHYQGIGVRS
jgi:UDPglucose 6-dehydrogenase